MDDDTEVWVQLVTKVPLRVHREAKMHAIATDRTLTTFIVEALREKLDADAVPVEAAAGASC